MKSPQTPDFKTLIYCERQRDFSGNDRIHQHCVNSFGHDLNAKDVHLLYMLKSHTAGLFLQ